jgi:hypothetical protein
VRRQGEQRAAVVGLVALPWPLALFAGVLYVLTLVVVVVAVVVLAPLVLLAAYLVSNRERRRLSR